jgi:hypothetical protein
VRRNFNGQTNWPQAVVAIGANGLHCHDLCHTGNAWAATSGAGAAGSDGPDGSRQRACRDHLPASGPGADTAITRAIDAHADAELRRDDGDGGSADGLAPVG